MPEDTVSTYGLIVLLARWALDLSKPQDRRQAEGLLGAILSVPFGDASWSMSVAVDLNVECRIGDDILGQDPVELCCVGSKVCLERFSDHPSPLAQRFMRAVGNSHGMDLANMVLFCMADRRFHWLLQQLVWWAGWFIENSSRFFSSLAQDARHGPSPGCKRRADIALGEELVQRSSGSRKTKAKSDAADSGLSFSWDTSVTKMLAKYFYAMRMAFDGETTISVGIDGTRYGGRGVLKMALANPKNIAAIAPPMVVLGQGRPNWPRALCSAGSKRQ